MTRSVVVSSRMLVGTLLVFLLAGLHPRAGEAALNVTGKWLLEDTDNGQQFVDVTQTGTSLSFTYIGVPFSGTINLTTGAFGVHFLNIAFIGGEVLADGLRLVGNVGDTLNPPPGGSTPLFRGIRCECYDGNALDGDGCDGRCQVEPCYTCTGAPSVCTPSADGAGCDDRDPCTSGETCTAGACGGGNPDATPCVSLAGQWFTH